MSIIKERIIGALTVMSNHDAQKIWLLIQNEFAPKSWEDIEEVIPDEWDLKMLDDIKNNPDCKKFVSKAEAYKELGL
jgi:hypothetical protein